MKNRKAIAIFGSLLLALGVYLAWCCRPFYVRPGLAFENDIPEDVRVVIREWWNSDEVFKPLPVTWDGLCFGVTDEHV